MRHKNRGFTLMEMMVVVTISLAMMLLILPIFQITTRTVKTVERKLALYEAARNILDLIVFDIMQAALNERGEHLSIKNLNYIDNDPFTDPANSAGATDRYGRTSRREADAVGYLKLQGGGFRFAENLQLAGSMAFPLCYPEIIYRYPEAWKCSMRTSLAYTDMASQVYDKIPSWSRATQLNDVSLISMFILSHTHTGEHRMPGNATLQFDPVPNSLAPGYEIRQANNTPDDPAGQAVGMKPTDLMRSRARCMGGVKLLDLDVAFWDDLEKKYKELADDTAMYFWPAPKAVRVTITVCDREKRGTLTLARVVQVPVGLGACGEIAFDASKGDLVLNTTGASDTTRMDNDNAPFNRSKKLGIATNETSAALLGK